MSSVPSNATKIDDNLLEALGSSKDRTIVLRVEQDIVQFLEDASRSVLEVTTSNSYQRRLAHKAGDYYQLSHVSDSARQVLLFHKHPWSSVPPQKLCDVIVSKEEPAVKPRVQVMQKPARQVQIMKRAALTAAPEQPKPVTLSSEIATDVKGKDKLDKEERYKAARARIFQGIEESTLPTTKDKPSRANSKVNSRSNSRDARHKSTLNGDAQDFTRRISESYLYEATSSTDDLIQRRHQQYFQSDPQLVNTYQRPPIDGNKNFPGVWNPNSSAPLSAANLATLEAQTSKQSTISPVLQRADSPDVGKRFSPGPVNRSLAPPVIASGNLWGPPSNASPQAQRTASSMGLNLSASPWTPKQHATAESSAPLPVKLETAEVMDSEPEDHDEDPTNILRGLALDDK